MGGLAVFPSLLPLFVVIMMRRAEERIHRQLAGAGALAAESAVPLSLSRSLERRRLQALIDGGAVRLTSNDRYFLDADGWSTYHSNRRRRALFAVSVVVALLGLVAAAILVLR